MSSTSVSWRISSLPHFAQAVGSSLATVMSPQWSQNQAGIRCPHQIWREMHQSRMFSIQS